MSRKVKIVIRDMVRDLLYYDRKDDEELPVGDIEQKIEAGDLTIKEMSKIFHDALEEFI